MGVPRQLTPFWQVFALGSCLVWCTLLVGFGDSKGPAWFPFSGCWVIYLVSEAALLALWLTVEKRTGQPSIFLTGLRTLRLSVLLILCMLAGTRIIRAKCAQTDEERTPLLGNNIEEPAHIQRASGDHGYATMANGRTTSANDDHTNQNTKTEGDESKERWSSSLETFMVSLLPCREGGHQRHIWLIHSVPHSFFLAQGEASSTTTLRRRWPLSIAGSNTQCACSSTARSNN